MSDNTDIGDAGWIPVPDCGEPADQYMLNNLDLLSEATHPVRGVILRRLRQPLTVAELAALLDVPTTRLYHHVNRLTELELIRVVATRQVAAVTERRYQVVARSFGIDPELLNSTDQHELAAALCSLFDVARLGFQRYIESGGLNDVDPDGEQSTLSLAEVRLSPRRRRELITRVTELIDEFRSDADETDPNGTPITMFVAVYEELS
jgi:hypothetical protein